MGYIKWALALCILLGGIWNADAQSEGEYRSVNDGVWTTASNWEIYSNGGWTAATAAPDTSATVTITNDISLEAGGWFGWVPGQNLAFSGEMTIGQGGALTRGNYSTFSIVAGGEVHVLEGGTIDIASSSPGLGYGDLSNGGTLNIEGGTVVFDDFSGSGTTTMTEGTLQVNGSFNPDSGAIVNISGGTVDGNIPVASDQIFSPADTAVGTVTVEGTFTFASGSTYRVDVAGSSSDRLVVSTTLTLGGATLSVDTAALQTGATYIIAQAATNSGTFAGYGTASQEIGTSGFYLHYVDGVDGNPDSIQINSSPTPTSSGIDVRAFQTSEGTVVEFVAYDVEADGTIRLALLDDNGEATWQGSVAVTAGPRFFARFLVPGLELGGSYNFLVRDEVGKWWQANGVTVEAFATEMTSASLAGITLSFESLVGHDYEIQWVPALGTPWQSVTNVTASGAQTEVVVPHPDAEGPSGFFRLQMK